MIRPPVANLFNPSDILYVKYAGKYGNNDVIACTYMLVKSKHVSSLHNFELQSVEIVPVEKGVNRSDLHSHSVFPTIRFF